MQQNESEKWIIGEDNVCPVTKKQCDDECCPTGATCNLKASIDVGIEPEKSVSTNK